MKVKLIIFISLLIANISLMAQGQQDEKRFKQGIGIAAGTTTSFGLSYRYNPNRFTVQLAFSPEIEEDFNICHTGLSFMFNFIELKKVNFLIYQSNYYKFTQQTGSISGNFSRDDYRYYHSFSHGMGLGVEFKIYKRIGLNLMGGYATYKNNTKMGITLDSGVFFKF